MLFRFLITYINTLFLEIHFDSLFKFKNWLARVLQGQVPSKPPLSNCPDAPTLTKTTLGISMCNGK